MAPTQEDGQPQPELLPQSQPQPGEKTLHVWSKPVENEAATENGATKPNARPTITEAVGMIKKDDFANIANTPCARQGFVTGIASGAGLGGLKKCDQGCQLGRRILRPREHGILRILPVPATGRAPTDEATDRSGDGKQKGTSKEADGGKEGAPAVRGRAKSRGKAVVQVLKRPNQGRPRYQPAQILSKEEEKESWNKKTKRQEPVCRRLTPIPVPKPHNSRQVVPFSPPT
ncbi:Cytochrome c oxidase protein 20, mitochondrial [Ilyonectria robusta]